MSEPLKKHQKRTNNTTTQTKNSKNKTHENSNHDKTRLNATPPPYYLLSPLIRQIRVSLPPVRLPLPLTYAGDLLQPCRPCQAQHGTHKGLKEAPWPCHGHRMQTTDSHCCQYRPCADLTPCEVLLFTFFYFYCFLSYFFLFLYDFFFLAFAYYFLLFYFFQFPTLFNIFFTVFN